MLLENDAGRQGHLEHPRVQSPGLDLRHAGRRRQPGGTAARLHGARHAEQPEHAAAQRRQRRRSGGDRVLDELLRPERRSRTSRSSTGAQDISVGHRLATSINMVTKSGHQPVQRPGAADLPGRSDAVGQHRRDAAGRRASGPNANAVDYITNANFQAGGPLLKNKLFYFGIVQLPADARERPRVPGRVAAAVPVQLGDTSNQDTTDILTGTGQVDLSA